MNNINMEKDNAFLESSITDSANSKKLAEIIYMQNRILNIPTIINELDIAKSTSGNKNLINSSILLKVMEEARKSVSIESLQGDGLAGTLTIMGTGSDEFSSSNFISSLKETEIFSKIEYSGYTSNRANEYTFTVVCILK
jgi:hypothetical protein